MRCGIRQREKRKKKMEEIRKKVRDAMRDMKGEPGKNEERRKGCLSERNGQN